MSQFDEEQKRREALKKKREERKRARKRKVLIARSILLALLLVILLSMVVLIGRVFKKNAKTEAKQDTSAQAGTAAQTKEEQSALAEGESKSTAASAEQPVATISSEEVMTAASKEEALEFAKAYATQYDYDKAVTVIQNFDPNGSDEELNAAMKQYTDEKAACVAVDVTNVPHVFFHSLINDDRGLRADIVGEDRAWRNDAAMTTADEFDHMMEDMYEAGYVMVSLNDLCIKKTGEDGTTYISPNTNLLLPEGKKAFVLSEDDLSYYHTYGIGTQGYATRMLVDENGEVKCEYTDENGETKIGDYDVVPRMDTFVKNHPGFSYHGHKGTVAMTGYNGVFGYRTNDYYKDINNENLSADQVQWLKDHPDFNWDQDVADATAVANAMKANGWTFASHTYGHWNASSKTKEQLQSDNERWMTVNHNILGDIDIIIFAFGGDIGGVGGYTADNEKYQYFKSQGYNIFCNVDGNIGWTEFGDQYMRTGRVALDGFTMYQAMTESGASHSTYAHDYEVLGIKNISEFFNPHRITPIEGE